MPRRRRGGTTKRDRPEEAQKQQVGVLAAEAEPRGGEQAAQGEEDEEWGWGGDEGVAGELPWEIWVNVLQFVSCGDVARFGLACRLFSAIADMYAESLSALVGDHLRVLTATPQWHGVARTGPARLLARDGALGRGCGGPGPGRVAHRLPGLRSPPLGSPPRGPVQEPVPPRTTPPCGALEWTGVWSHLFLTRLNRSAGKADKLARSKHRSSFSVEADMSCFAVDEQSFTAPGTP